MALQFVIIQQDSLIAVDNTAISPLSLTGLATNIGQVSFQKDAGKVQYNDRPPNPVEFTDPSPYQIYLNRWITAAAALVLPLQLAQAKQVKYDLVEAIYHYKRRVPFVSAGTTYEASDEALISYVGLGVSGINGNLGSFASQINSNIVSPVNTWSPVHASNWSLLHRDPGTGSIVSTGDPNNSPGSGVSAVSFGGGANAVANGIIARRNLLYTDKTNKQTAINALATFDAVIAYDATTGWSS